MTDDRSTEAPVRTLSFEAFWDWILQHPNCVLRAGTPDAVLFDHEHLHWNFAVEGSAAYVQLIHGKRLNSELLIEAERVAYVQGMEGEQEGEHLFELVQEDEKDRLVAYFFVLSHGLETEDVPAPTRAVH